MTDSITTTPATTIPDGVYFLHPEGSAWIAVEYRDGKRVGSANESDYATHTAANDEWAGVCPDDSDVEVTGEVAAAILAGKPHPDMFVVTRPRSDEDKFVCGCTVQHDNSGVGANWRTIAAADIPHAAREEIEGEIIDGKREEGEIVASNGLRYRWF